MYLSSIQVTQFESNSIQALGSSTLARVFLKFFNAEIVEYSTTPKIEIVFGENNIEKTQRSEVKKIYPRPRYASGKYIPLNK